MYCSKGDIKVGGENAEVCQETCCESFQERKRENARSSMGTPSTVTDVRCEATHCKYNDQCNCNAGHVDISGAAACNCRETECVTFDKE
jgi:hypothetical protein